MMHLNHKKLDAPFLGIHGAPQPLHEERDWGEEHCNSKRSIIGTVSRVIISIKLMRKKREKGNIFQPVNSILFSKRYLERLLLQDLTQAPQKRPEKTNMWPKHHLMWKLFVSIN